MSKITELLVRKDNLNFIKTNKYKNILISIKCAFEYDKKLRASLSILALMLQEQCQKYPNKVEFARARDMLYDLDYDVICASSGNLITFSFNYNFTNPSFIETVNNKDYIDFIEETTKHPLLNEKLFNESKRIYIDFINRKKEKPSYYANNQFANCVAKEDSFFEMYTELENDYIESLVIQDIENVYNNLFNSRVDIFLIGDYSDVFDKYLSTYISKKDIKILMKPLVFNNNKEIVEKKEVGQSALIVSYNTPYLRSSKQYYAYNLGNILFGGTPSSLLFSNVREKDNLCYVINSRALKYVGLVYVTTLIDRKNKDKALEEIRKQFNRIINKDYDSNLLEVAKKMLISNVLSLDDDLDYLINYYYNSFLSDTFEPVDEYIKHIKEVSIDDVSNVFSNFKEYVVYFLEGINNGKNI